MPPRLDENLEAESAFLGAANVSCTVSKTVEEVAEELTEDEEKQQIINAIGGWGRWQLTRCSLVLVIIWLPASFHLLNSTFYTAATDYWALRPPHLVNITVESWIAYIHPQHVNFQNQTSYDFCRVRKTDFTQLTEEEVDKAGDVGEESEYVACTAWEYDRSFWARTLIMDFDLVCERESYKKLNQQVAFFGLMVGAMLSGLLSDRFGRRRTMLLLLLVLVVAGTCSSFSSNFTVFLVSVWFCGFSSLGYGTVMYVWMMEHISGKPKTIMGASPHFCFAFWGLMTAVLCYLVRDWRQLQLIFSVPCIVLVGAYFLLPESPRWLLAHGRREEAEVLCRRIAKYNGKQLPDSFRLRIKSCNVGGDGEASEKGRGWLGFLQLFKTPNLRKKTLICYYLWFSTALVYYGLTLNSNNIFEIPGGIFVTFSIGKIMEFPSIALVIFLLLRGGRRNAILTFYLVGGLSLLLSLFVPLGVFPYEWPIAVFNVLGRVCLIGTLAICYIYSSEIFPTVVRNVGLGSSSLWARVGPIVAPYISSLGVYDKRYPAAIFGLFALTAGLLVTFLPETSHTHLPDTIQESEELGKGDTLWASCCQKQKKKITKNYC